MVPASRRPTGWGRERKTQAEDYSTMTQGRLPVQVMLPATGAEAGF